MFRRRRRQHRQCVAVTTLHNARTIANCTNDRCDRVKMKVKHTISHALINPLIGNMFIVITNWFHVAFNFALASSYILSLALDLRAYTCGLSLIVNWNNMDVWGKHTLHCELNRHQFFCRFYFQFWYSNKKCTPRNPIFRLHISTW